MTIHITYYFELSIVLVFDVTKTLQKHVKMIRGGIELKIFRVTLIS